MPGLPARDKGVAGGCKLAAGPHAAPQLALAWRLSAPVTSSLPCGCPFPLQTLINFFTGMVVACFVFLVQLPSLIWSYQPALVRAGRNLHLGRADSTHLLQAQASVSGFKTQAAMRTPTHSQPGGPVAASLTVCSGAGSPSLLPRQLPQSASSPPTWACS